MSAEVTASILIGPIEPNSTHGKPTGQPGDRRLFAPSHVLVLMENSRATWIAQRCPELQGATPAQRIQPASPSHLLAAALLGYTALIKPDALAGSERLRALTAPEPRKTLNVEPIDEDLAHHIYDYCTEHVYAAVTKLPGSTIKDDELRLASGAGLLVAIPGGDRHGT